MNTASSFRSLQLLIFTSLVMLFACKQEPQPNKDLLMPEDEFVEMLSEAHIFQAFSQMKKDRNLETFPLDEAYKWLLEKYQTTDTSFRYSLNYYATDQKKFEEIYDEVIMRISEKEAEFNATKTVLPVEENQQTPPAPTGESE